MPYIAVYSYPRRNIDWIQFFFPSVSYSISRNVLGFVFSPPFLMFPVHCSEQYCPWLCKQCNVFCRLFLFLIPRSSFLFSYLLCNTQYSFDTVFSLCYRLTSVFFTILVLCPACCSTRNLSTVCVYRCAWAWISGEICSILRTLAVIDIFG